MKIYLDDERKTPSGWTRVYWPDEVIEFLKKGNVDVISLDHDLGDDSRGTGYDVLLWIEEKVSNTKYIPPEIIIHTANISARRKMEAAVIQIQEILKRRKNGHSN